MTWSDGYILVSIYTSGHRSPTFTQRDHNAYTYPLELLGFILMLLVYFKLRNYLYNYYDDYKAPLISGAISIFSIAFLMGLLYEILITF